MIRFYVTTPSGSVAGPYDTVDDANEIAQRVRAHGKRCFVEARDDAEPATLEAVVRAACRRIRWSTRSAPERA